MNDFTSPTESILDDFDRKRETGENDTYIAEMIRNDLVDDFISYVTRTNTSLTSTIPHSIFETNLYLYGKNPTLIEYTAFSGSIQIFHY